MLDTNADHVAQRSRKHIILAILERGTSSRVRNTDESDMNDCAIDKPEVKRESQRQARSSVSLKASVTVNKDCLGNLSDRKD